MSILLKTFRVAAFLAIAATWAHASAWSQETGTADQKSSVLPTGGGQALLDPSDSVLLLLDHQAGLLQTVKDIGVAELRANTTMLAKLATRRSTAADAAASVPPLPSPAAEPTID